jgi:hypothetical protein
MVKHGAITDRCCIIVVLLQNKRRRPDFRKQSDCKIHFVHNYKEEDYCLKQDAVTSLNVYLMNNHSRIPAFETLCLCIRH